VNNFPNTTKSLQINTPRLKKEKTIPIITAGVPFIQGPTSLLIIIITALTEKKKETNIKRSSVCQYEFTPIYDQMTRIAIPMKRGIPVNEFFNQGKSSKYVEIYKNIRLSIFFFFLFRD
jgi:hypothetical protein